MKQELGNLMAEDPQQETINLLTYRLIAVTEQRDRLAEAMQEMWPFIEEDDYPNCNTPAFNAAILKYKIAIAAVEGGSDE